MCAIAWEPVDRLPIKHEAREEVNRVLMKYLNIKDEEFLYLWLGDDFHRVKPFYCGPVLQRFPDGKWEGPWGEIWHTVVTESGIYNETVYLPYRDTQRLEELEGRRFPSADWYDFSSIRAQCEAAGERCVLFGDPAHFEIINGISRLRGAEQVLMDLASEDPVYLFLADARYHFYYELTERALIASEGKIDIVHCGQDLGTQSGPLISPYTFDRIFAPRLDEYFSMIHGHGAKVMMHSCGSTRKFIPRLIELGLDILDVVQPSAKGMNMQELQDEYAGELCFAGTMDVQTVLPNGCPEDVIKAVELRWSLFKNGGLLIGPSHQIQGDTPIENILAMYHAARNYQSR
jgi:uroporphyrinogen decarboxylase